MKRELEIKKEHKDVLIIEDARQVRKTYLIEAVLKRIKDKRFFNSY